MRDNLDLQELRERIESYQQQQRAIRNRSQITALGIVIVLIWLWAQPTSYDGFWGREMINLVKNLSLVCFPLIWLFLVIYIWHRPNQKLLKARSQRASKYMAHLFRNMPDTTDPQASTKTQDNFTKAYNLVLTILFGWLFIVMFDGSGVSSSTVLLCIIGLLMTFVPVIKTMIMTKISTSARRYLLGEIRDRTLLWITIVVVSFVIMMYMGTFAISLQFAIYEQQLLNVSTLILLYFVAMYIYSMVRQYTQFYNPLRDGKYAVLDERLRAIAEYSQDMGTLYWLGLIAQFHGESEIAEAHWHDLIQTYPANNVQVIGVALNNLASNRLTLGDNDEALKFFEASIRLTPELAGIYRGLMNFYNRLDIEPERVFELSELMISLTRKPRWNHMFSFSEWSQTLAASAVAHARIGDFDKAQALIEQAFNECDQRFKSNITSLHNSKAKIALLANDPEQARTYYSQAVSIDPESAEGKFAQKALTEMQSS